MKLELKHLAPYLTYDLQMYYETLKGKKTSWTLRCGTIGEAIVNQNKPILHPLSDLTKEIDVNGEKFVPMDYWDEEIKGNDYNSELLNMAENNYFDGYLPYFVVQKLISWHFDIHDLIKNGLAIDINTLNK